MNDVPTLRSSRDSRFRDLVRRTATLPRVMTTWDPDILVQDSSVLRRIAHELDGTLSHDSLVEEERRVHVGDQVELIRDHGRFPLAIKSLEAEIKLERRTPALRVPWGCPCASD